MRIIVRHSWTLQETLIRIPPFPPSPRDPIVTSTQKQQPRKKKKRIVNPTEEREGQDPRRRKDWHTTQWIIDQVCNLFRLNSHAQYNDNDQHHQHPPFGLSVHVTTSSGIARLVPIYL